MKKLMITLGMFATFCTTEAKVTLPALFTDNMVLQQKSDIILRGHSTNRKEVMVITGKHSDAMRSFKILPDRKSTRLNSSHASKARMPSSA